MKSSKLRKMYLWLIELSPHLRSLLIRTLYNTYVRYNKPQKSIFLNYGYHDDAVLSLHQKDELNRYFIQLYHRVVRDIDLEHKDVVEVGCGQGGGGSFLIEYKNPRSYIGIDLSAKAIQICKHNSKFAEAKWLQGSAEALPIPDESIDVVVNVESSHCYYSMEQFLHEVWRILRPNGYFAFTDLRNIEHVKALDDALQSSNMRILQRMDITQQVIDSLDYVSDRRKTQINATFPRFLRQSIRELCAVKGSSTYLGFISGRRKYFYYLLQKSSITSQ